MKEPFRQHLHSSQDLETACEAIRAGFVALALEKNRRATPFVEEAKYQVYITASEFLAVLQLEARQRLGLPLGAG